MSNKCDAQLRYEHHCGGDLSEAELTRASGLDKARRARAGDWSEAELSALLGGQHLDRSAASADLKRACLGAGSLDRRISLGEASSLLGLSCLEQAVREGELATFPGGKDTSEARLGAWIISQEIIPQGDPAAALRMVFLCGLHAGQRLAA